MNVNSKAKTTRIKLNARTLAAAGAILLTNQLALADASFQSSTQITGGSLTDALKSVSFMKSTRDLLAPMVTTTMVHGNQRAVVERDSIEIVDLDKETITRIDTVKKTYTVVTFAQMRQGMASATQQLQQAQKQPAPQQAPPPKSDVKMSFDVKVKNTGLSKSVNGVTAQEQLITMTMTATDPNAQPSNGVTSVAYVVTTDSWIAPDPPEVKEVQEFDVRMAKKMMAGVDLSGLKTSLTASGTGYNPGMAMMFANQPGAMDGIAQMGKEMTKLQGTHIMDVTSMGGSANGGAVDPSQCPTTPAAPADAPPQQSKTSMLGSALGKSALGRFGVKKSDSNSNNPPPPPAGSNASAAPTCAIMMSMTTQKSNFSSGPIPASSFEVPAGYKQVASPYTK